MLRMWASICVATMEIEVPHNSPDSSWPMGTDVLLYSQCGVRLSFALAADIDPACVSRTEEAVEVRLDSPPTSSFDEDQQAQRESEKSKEHVEPSQDVTGLGSYEETRTHLTDLMQQYRVCQAKRRLVRRRIDIIRRRGGQHSAGSRGRRGTYAHFKRRHREPSQEQSSGFSGDGDATGRISSSAKAWKEAAASKTPATQHNAADDVAAAQQQDTVRRGVEIGDGTRVQWPWVGVSPPQNSLNAELQTAQVLQVHVVQPPARVLIPTEPSASAALGAFGTSADPVLTEGLLREVHPRPAASRNRRFPATPVRYTVEPPEPERAAAEAGTGPTTLDRFGMEEEETAVSAESALAKETAPEPSTITTPELRLSPVTSALSPAATEDEGTSTTAGQPRRQQKASKFIRRLRRTKLGALRRGRTPYIMERAYVLASRQQGETGYATQLDQGTIPTLPRAGNVSIIPGMVSAPELLPSQTGESASDRTSQWPFVNLRQPLFLLTTAHESSAVPQPFVRPSGELVAPQSGSSSAEAPGPWMSAYTDYAVEPNSDREYAAAADGSNVERRQ
ncbi:hypothetical protein BESB_029940 [Besnoitia besnoiti]|uniref:Uncharacterized protein n=1 Tax=Besnoitia besnoiti TaxID=94643 RepID=A0A2A9M6S6_BESBE|nr:hypothetical protein BESB_029940 [Besnoitia besnoiti]PFH31120.1 hypothetical protein BESB_029940 [Besnoitia besnoiti]